MMKKISKLLLLSPIVFSSLIGLTSCSKTTEFTLRILNSEDYIYLKDEDDPNDKDLVDQFKDYIKENYPEYKNVSIVYDTSDTNETIYSEIQTGKSNYDLINVSEYMAQKIVSGGYAIEIDRSKIPNYDAYASKEIKSRLDEIETTQKVFDEATQKYVDKVVKLENYAVGYMWGTLGILFNPDYHAFADIDLEEIVTDMSDFDALWNTKYKGTISIKNSMRDTYALGIMHAFKEDFQNYMDYLEAGVDASGQEYTLDDYKADFAATFNRSDEEAISLVEKALKELKGNIFGLEVDSGKQDIVTQKIGVNLAWSGDACYAIEQAEGNGVTLLYSVPELGSNIWSDVWIMPDCARSDAQYELAHLFLDFLSDPEIASKNMAYTGYTSFIGGDSIIDLVRDWYDIRADEIYETIYSCTNEECEWHSAEKPIKGVCPLCHSELEENSYQVYAVSSTEFRALDYSDFISTSREELLNNYKLRYFEPFEDDEGELVEEPRTLDELLENGDYVYLRDDNDRLTAAIKKYADLTIVDESEDIQTVDLSYFFAGTLEEYEEADMIFYSDDYLPFTYEDGSENKSVGGMFYVQYPNEETINRCAVMVDYGENNKMVMKMWENFKSDNLPTWAVIVFITFIVSLLALIAYFVIDKILVERVRRSRKS